MHIALYRKYRSTTFDDVCGQDHITSVLKYQSKTGRASHAYLFCGSRGTGKTSCAKILAKSVNCEAPVDGNPCGKCASCQLIDKGNCTDVIEMDAASDTGVDYIRGIKEEVQYSPLFLKKKVYIIDEVHMLTDQAFNALLKTLEEPPEHVVFVLATTEVHKIPSTVVSRCQRFDFRRLSVETLMNRLAYIAEKEGISLEESAARLIAKQAQGGMRDAISLFELCSGGGADVTEARVFDILGVGGYENAHNTALAVAKGDMATLFEVVAQTVASSKDISVFWQELISFYRDMLVSKYADDPKKFLDLTESEFALLTSAADNFKLADLFYQSRILDDTLRDMNRMPQNKRTIAEFALMRMCEASLDTSNAALLARIDALEEAVNLLKGGAVLTASPVKAEKKADVIAEKKAEPVKAQKAPVNTGASASEGTFMRVPDLSEAASKLSDPMAKSLLMDCRAEASADGARVKLITTNPFVPVYFDREKLRLFGEALLQCKITDRVPEIEVSLKEASKERVSDDLFNV